MIWFGHSLIKKLISLFVFSYFENNITLQPLKIVFKALGKKNKAEKELADIMGGKVLEFSADKIFNAGRIKGKAEMNPALINT